MHRHRTMRASSPLLVAGLVVSLSCVASHAAALECEGAANPSWTPQRSWPAACEPDVPTDGFVLLEGDALEGATASGEGALSVTLQRMHEGVALETFDGQLTYPDATSALFRSARPLAASADYQITAQRVAPDGRTLGERFTSKFTTGVRSLAPLTFHAAPELSIEQFDKEVVACTTDACGAKHCEGTDESVPATFARVAVPPIQGGIEQRPYAVAASLTLGGSTQAAPVATSDSAATQAGKRSYLVIEVPRDTQAREACVTVSATDLAGRKTSTPPVCVALPEPEPLPALARTSPTSESAASALASSPGFDDVTGEQQSAGADAGGCAIGATGRGANGLGWLALVLTLARLRSRKRAF
jgi:hypothetical protein